MHSKDAVRAKCCRRIALFLSIPGAVAISLLTAGCGAMNDPNNSCIKPPSPNIQSYHPTSIHVHAGIPRVVLDGSGFTTESHIFGNNFELPMIYTSSTEVTGTLTASQVAVTQPVTIVVFNAFPSACAVGTTTGVCSDVSSRCGNVSNSVVVQVVP